MRYFQRLMLVGFCFAISGCVSAAMVFTPPTAPLASAQADAEAKRFKALPGKASIYVIREDAFTAQGSLFQVSVDGNSQGKLSRGTYFLFTVPPGKHVIDFNEYGVRGGKETIYAVEGGVYYLEIRPRLGIIASSTKIFRIDQQRGRQLILGGRCAEIKPAD
jgi:hypothetical protein